jgi:hypothetical protein
MVQLYLVVVMDPLEFQALGAKVDQKPDFHIVGFQIVHRLRQVNILKPDNRLQFNHNQTFDEEVDPARADLLSAVKDWHLLLTFKGKVLEWEFNRQSPLVNDLLEPVPQRRVDLHSRCNHASCGILIQH